MSILSFNCRGLGETQTVDDLRSLIRRNSPKIVFLSETKRSGVEMEWVRKKLGNFFGVYVDSRGRAGGLALFWEKSVKLNLCSFSGHHMDANICWEDDAEEWRFTGVYGWPESHNKSKTAALIENLSSHSNLPWIIGGDLNEIFYHSEKRGGPQKSNSHIDGFRNAFLDHGLYDMGFEGYEFTWSRWQHGQLVVEERLDRFCASTEWSLLFLDAKVIHIDWDSSDHLPIILKCFPYWGRGGRHKPRFRFENMWLTDPSCREVIFNAWK